MHYVCFKKKKKLLLLLLLYYVYTLCHTPYGFRQFKVVSNLKVTYLHYILRCDYVY